MFKDARSTALPQTDGHLDTCTVIITEAKSVLNLFFFSLSILHYKANCHVCHSLRIVKYTGWTITVMKLSILIYATRVNKKTENLQFFFKLLQPIKISGQTILLGCNA